jgi:hypothetical protein
MKKIFLSLFLLVFTVLPNKAAGFNYEKLKNTNMIFSDGTTGSSEVEGFFVMGYEAPNCKKFNQNLKILRQGQSIAYKSNGKVAGIEKGLFDCRLSNDNKPVFTTWEGIVDFYEPSSRIIIFKNDNVNAHMYSQVQGQAWTYFTRNVNVLYNEHPNANISQRLATKDEIEHAEKLYNFYKSIDLSSRSAKKYGDKILNNNILNTSSISKTSSSSSSSSSKLPNCVGSFNEKTWTNCYGIYKWSNPNDKYDGEFLNGNRHGFGTYFYANGNKYIGEWNNDRPNGKGTMIFASGAKYIGEVKNGKRHGQGSYFYSDGERLTGKWNEGEFVDSSSYKKLENDNSNFYKKSKSTENTKLRSSSGVKEYWWVVILLIGIIFFVYTQTKKDLNINTERSFKPKIRETHNIITQFVEGKKSLGFSFWIAYALLTTINFFLFSILDDYAAKNNLNSLIPQIFAWVVIGCYIFSCIGSWNSATNYKLQKIRTKEPFVWATAAYVTIVVMSILLGLGVIQGFLEAI